MSHNLSIEKIKDILNLKKISCIPLYGKELNSYNGIYEEYHIIYNKNYFMFRHLLTCYGLDGFGDDLYKSYEYFFNTIEEIIVYLENKLQIKLKDMPLIDFKNIVTQIDSTREQEEEFLENWKRFERDFDEGKFLDKNLKLIE